MTQDKSEKLPHPLDVAVGTRIRVRRKQLGMSQTKLGGGVGITFQQIQKYESGVNRISISRLAEICGVLDCSFLDLLHGLGPKSTPIVPGSNNFPIFG